MTLQSRNTCLTYTRLIWTQVQQQQVGGQVPCSRTPRWWLLRDGGWNVTHTHHLQLQNQCEDLTPTAETDPPSVPSTHSSAGQHG